MNDKISTDNNLSLEEGGGERRTNVCCINFPSKLKEFENSLESQLLARWAIDSLPSEKKWRRRREKRRGERSMDVDAKCEPRYISVDRYVVPVVVGHRENIFIINSGRRPTRKQLRALSRIFRECFVSLSLSRGEFLLVSHGAFLVKDLIRWSICDDFFFLSLIFLLQLWRENVSLILWD